MIIGLLGSGIHILDSVIDIVRKRFLLLLLGDETLVIHVLEYDLAPFRIFLTSGYGV